MLMCTNKEVGLLINVIGKTVQPNNLRVMMRKFVGMCLVFLAPIIVTGKMSLHATVQRNITYDEHVNNDIQLHSSID